MPIYEYECMQCGQIEEALQKFSDKPLKKCRHCAGKLVKLVSQGSFHLKGSGWYVTDYADKSKKSAPSSQKTEDSKTVESKSADTDSPPAKKSSDSSDS